MAREYRPWTAEEDTVVRDDALAGRTATHTARALDRSVGSITNRRFRLGLNGHFATEAPRPVAPPVETVATAPADARVLESPPSPRVQTLDQLLAAACVDLDTWSVERYVVNKWEVGAKLPNGTVAIEPLWQVKAWLARTTGTVLAAHVDRLLAGVAADTAHRRYVAPPRPAARGLGAHMLEVCLFDLHLGKLAWAPETGDHYDARIAETVARAALEDLLWQAERYPLDRIVLPIGNDYFHVDGLAGLTTGGTPQDRDSRYHFMFERGRALASWMIELCAQVAPVLVPIVPGNHDETSAFTLGTVLTAEYKADPRVTVDNSPRLRKYVRYGANLIGYTHGKEERVTDLPNIMATEQPQAWGETTFREWHIGHRHRPKQMTSTPVDSKLGVRVREISSVSGTDAWHARKGYVGEPKQAEAFIWTFAGGVRAHLHHLADRAPYAPATEAA